MIEAIRDTAFVASDYPVILSFENHCNRNNQLQMAKICINTFGDLLMSEPLKDYPVCVTSNVSRNVQLNISLFF